MEYGDRVNRYSAGMVGGLARLHVISRFSILGGMF